MRRRGPAGPPPEAAPNPHKTRTKTAQNPHHTRVRQVRAAVLGLRLAHTANLCGKIAEYKLSGPLVALLPSGGLSAMSGGSLAKEAVAEARAAGVERLLTWTHPPALPGGFSLPARRAAEEAAVPEADFWVAHCLTVERWDRLRRGMGAGEGRAQLRVFGCRCAGANPRNEP